MSDERIEPCITCGTIVTVRYDEDGTPDTAREPDWRALLEALAADDPHVYGDIDWCVWCSQAWPDHADDCAWLAARKALGK